MNILAFIISLICLIWCLSWKKNKKIISPITMFFALWCFIIFLSILNLYDIYKPSDEAYFLIILMLVFFFVGSFLGMMLKNNYNIENKIRIELKNKLFFGLSFICIILNILDILIIFKLYRAGNPMWQIRNWSLEPYGSSNPILNRRSFIEECIRSMIIGPFATLIPPITAFYFFHSEDKKLKKKLLINSIVVLVFSSLAGGGGRLGYIYYIGCFLLSFMAVNRNKEEINKLIKKYKKNIKLITIFGLIIAAVYTTVRTGKGNLIKQFYTYFALPPTLLSLWLREITNIKYTYGFTTFFGVHSYFFRVFETLGMSFLVPNIYNISFDNILGAEEFKNVGYGIGNAFVTPIYYFYKDGGIPFIIFASVLFGYIVAKIYKVFYNNINVKNFVIYALVTYGVFLTFIRIQTAIPSYIISFIFAKIIFKKCYNDG